MQQISTERVQDETPLGGQGDPQGNEQEIEIWPYKQIVYAQPSSCPKNDTHKLLRDFNIHTDHLFTARRADIFIINKKKMQNCRLWCRSTE